MSNLVADIGRSRDYYKGKSIDFAGLWTPGVRYFNDDYITNFVVYAEKDNDGKIIASALLGCKQSHLAKTAYSDRTSNEPILIKDDIAGVVGIEPNDYWIFICGSLRSISESAIIVPDYIHALLEATAENKGKIIYVEDPKSAYLVVGPEELTRIVIGNEVDELNESKVDKVDGKGLSTEDYTTEEKEKLSKIEDNAQVNVIEQITLNGQIVKPVGKRVDLTFKKNSYTIEKNTYTSGEYLASYVLKENGAQVGATINIPKDIALLSGDIKEVVNAGSPFSGARLGDKYIDLLLNDANKTHVYIPAMALVDVYDGSKYISTENHTVTLQYDTLKRDLESSENPINIKIQQVDGLKKKLDYLESDESGVKSITGTDSKIVLSGKVQFDSNIFSLDKASNTISVAAGKFEVAGESKETEKKIIGNESDTFEKNLTLYGLKAGIKDLKANSLHFDSIGPGLIVKQFNVNNETVNKVTIDVKEGSALTIDKDGKLDLTWSNNIWI